MAFEKGNIPWNAGLDLSQRFWSKVDKTGPCWIWTAARKKPEGYGFFFRGGRNHYAHRIAWELTNDSPIPQGYLVCHTCDTPPCVNPDHLFLGLAKDNVADCIAKGRRRCVRIGEDHPQAVLTGSDVLTIRAMSARGISYAEISALFGIHRVTVGEIVRREIWKHL